MILRSVQQMLPQHILAGSDYAVMHQTNHHFDQCVSVHTMPDTAEEVCDKLNRARHYDSANYNSPYAVVRIIHDEGDRDRDQMRVADVDEDSTLCVSTVDADGEIVDSTTTIGEYDATLVALRYVYEMLDADELPTHSILDRLRDFCEAAGLLEFA